MLARHPRPIAIAGTGRVAQALGRLLAERGEPVAAVGGRNPDRTRAAAAFIGPAIRPATLAELPALASRLIVAVSDGAIPEVARLLADAGMTGGVALHTCGNGGAELLAPLAAQGVSRGSLHPLQTVATPEQGVIALARCAWAIDGDPDALEWASGIASLAGGATLRIPPEARPLYHAAAVMAGNYVVALADAAAMLMSAAGIEEETALKAIGPLMETSLANALSAGPVRALTGPIQRGDVDTVSAHLAAIARLAHSVGALYRSAGVHAAGLAARGGLAPDRARMIEELLREGDRQDA
jgi:predicted short-subunit dehydrogenase-like oxidoreductase (DUF2520 family)